jgi:hypothetical protein
MLVVRLFYQGAKYIWWNYSIKQVHYYSLCLISWRFCHDCCRSMKEEKQKGMPQRAIEQSADVTTGYVAETFASILDLCSKVATGIKSGAKFYRTNDTYLYS